MKTIKTGTVNSKIKRGDQVVFIAGKEYAVTIAPVKDSRFAARSLPLMHETEK